MALSMHRRIHCNTAAARERLTTSLMQFVRGDATGLPIPVDIESLRAGASLNRLLERTLPGRPM